MRLMQPRGLAQARLTGLSWSRRIVGVDGGGGGSGEDEAQRGGDGKTAPEGRARAARA